MKYDAITFDSQAVITNSFHFDGGLLEQMKQFKHGATAVIVSEITVQEILSHLIAKTSDVKKHYENTHEKAIFYGLKPQGSVAFSGEGEVIDAESIAKTRFFAFIDSIRARLIKTDDVLTSELKRSESSPGFAGVAVTV